MIDYIIIGALGLVILLLLLVLLSGRKDELRRAVREESDRSQAQLSVELKLNRQELSEQAAKNRMESSASFENFERQLADRFAEVAKAQQILFENVANRINNLTRDNEMRMQKLEERVEKQLDTLRKTVDEQLNENLQKRVQLSFKQVTDQLAELYKSLAQVRELRTDMSSLQKVFSGIKTRGIWGEVQLDALLSQMLDPGQFVKNCKINPNRQNFVEFAIRMPGDETQDVLLPIDSKFPLEDYQRLVTAQDEGNAEAVEYHTRQLIGRIRQQAADIHGKYIDPPYSTNFAVMYLPVEGLFAEVLRVPGLMEQMQNQFRVSITGPTTLAALLNSLQMGFRTLAIQKKSNEVWRLLSAVKTTMIRHQDNLSKAYKNLQISVNQLGDAQKNVSTISNRLRRMEELPEADSAGLLPGLEIEGEEEE